MNTAREKRPKSNGNMNALRKIGMGKTWHRHTYLDRLERRRALGSIFSLTPGFS